MINTCRTARETVVTGIGFGVESKVLPLLAGLWEVLDVTAALRTWREPAVGPQTREAVPTFVLVPGRGGRLRRIPCHHASEDSLDNKPLVETPDTRRSGVGVSISVVGGGARTISAVSDSDLPAFEQADRPVQSDRRSRIAPVTSGKRRREEFGVRFQSVLCRDRNDPRVWPPTRPRRSETGSGSGTRTPKSGWVRASSSCRDTSWSDVETRA